jgi:hypothetical protein
MTSAQLRWAETRSDLPVLAHIFPHRCQTVEINQKQPRFHEERTIGAFVSIQLFAIALYTGSVRDKLEAAYIRGHYQEYHIMGCAAV